jgi:hypothetical protein
VATQLHRLIESGVPILMVSGAEDTDDVRMRRLLDSRSPDLGRTTFEMTSVAARTLKGFRSVPAQMQFVEVVAAWIRLLPRPVKTSDFRVS